jgi:hypothetical protein
MVRAAAIVIFLTVFMLLTSKKDSSGRHIFHGYTYVDAGAPLQDSSTFLRRPRDLAPDPNTGLFSLPHKPEETGAMDQTGETFAFIVTGAGPACCAAAARLSESGLARGKHLGGTSSIDGMGYMGGNPAGYARWRQRGRKGWDRDSVQQFFKKAQPPRMSNASHAWPFGRAMAEAASQAGIPDNREFKSGQQDGAGHYGGKYHAPIIAIGKTAAAPMPEDVR